MTQSLLNLPSAMCVADMVMTLTHVVGRSESRFTKEEQAFKWPGEQWSLEIRFPILTDRDKVAQLLAFGARLQGSYNYFLIGDPSYKTPRGTPTGTPVVDGADQAGDELDLRGFTPDSEGVFLEGDFIQVGEGYSSRLHMVTTDANSDADGKATITICPSLRYSPADGSAIVYNSPKGVFRMAQNDFVWSVSPGRQYRFGFSAIEAVNA